jgi:immune inhibitor A
MMKRQNWRWLGLTMVLALLLPLKPGFVGQAPMQEPTRVAIGAHRLAGTHLVPPSRDALMAELRKEGLPLDATPEEIEAAKKEWFARFQKQTDTWVNAEFQEWVLQREEILASGAGVYDDAAVAAIVPVTATVFHMAVEFTATETFTIPVEQSDGSCLTQTVTITGPLQGMIPPPPATDNFTLWYSPSVTADAKFYEKLAFGYEGAGRVRMDLTDPDDAQPGINLTGYTMQDYYDNVAGEGNVLITGTVEGWVPVPHSEGYYGADNCATGSHGGGAGVPVAQLVVDALEVFSQTNPSYWTDPNYWPKFDGNNDGIVDSFAVIHAGVGQEAGGGAEGTFSIWSHSSDLRNYSQWLDGVKVYEGGPGTADDIYVGPYTMQPESLDVGVLSEEFGHNFFGFPDLYTTDAGNSIGDWNIMSGGAWMGWLGGTVPASMPLWFKMIAAYDTAGIITPVNWHDPMVTRDYDDPTADVTIGQLEKTPDSVNKGVRVDLPDYQETTLNMAGTGKAAYSGMGRDQTDIMLTKSITVGTGVSGTLTMATYYDIEKDWDYGYVEVNGASVADMDGVTTNYDPNGNNLGNGITGAGSGTLRFDLSTYAGQTVTVALRYKTDAAVTNPGWWVDDVALDGALIDDFEGATQPGTFDQWTNSDPGWYVVPIDNTYHRYYLVEWRTNTKYDGMIAKTAYIHNYADDVHGDVVSRIPYNMPAALLYYRDTKYGSTYAMGPNRTDPPSLGSKYQLLIVDQNWEPVRIFSGTVGSPTAYEGYWTGRVSSYDAGLTLQATDPFTIPTYYGIPGLPPQVYLSKPAVTSFNDTLGYYGGFYFGAPCPAGYVCYNERDGSAVIPARDVYSTRMVDFYGNPIYGFYGYSWSPSWLGSGNPGGDSYGDSVQFGVNIDLVSKAGDDAYNSTATLRFSNYSVDFINTMSYEVVSGDTQVTYQTVVDNIGNETASGVELHYVLDSDLSIIGVNIDASDGSVADVEQGVGLKDVQSHSDTAPNADLLVTIPSLAAGEKMTVTLVAATPFSGPVEFYSELWAHDGQVDRGPWWLEISAEFPCVYLPLVVRE